jgi:6-phosphogluconolactonase
LTKSPTENILFAACDKYFLEGEIRAFEINPTGQLRLLASQNKAGSSTCHVTCDPLGKLIFVSSYGDGTLIVYGFDGKDFLGNPQILHYSGSGPNAERQEMAHIHQAVVGPSGKWLYACDLGSDKIWIHHLINNTKDLTLTKGFETPSGYGPRHLVFHPKLPVLYVLCELNSHVLTYSYDESGSIAIIADNTTLFKEDSELPSGAAIRLHPSNKSLYVSDRGNNSISVFSISDGNGKLELETRFSVEGENPRDFNIDPTGNWLLSANQNSDHIMPFRLNPDTGLPTGEVGIPLSCGTPVCILF